MERYDRGEQENLVLKKFRVKTLVWRTQKPQKPKKLKIFKNAQKDAYYYKTKKCVGC